jgi:hypothetical protein
MIGGADANLAMVEAGFAWSHREYAGEQSRGDRGLYEAAESGARRPRPSRMPSPVPVIRGGSAPGRRADGSVCPRGG